MIPPSFRGRTAALLALAVLLAAPPAAFAQDTAPGPFCLAGRPAPSCRAFLVAQGSYFPRLAGSARPAEINGRSFEATELEGHYEWEVGVMVNRGADNAVGGTLMVGHDGNGPRLALKARYRRWLGRHAALDAAAGVLHARRDLPGGPPYDEPGLGLTGDVSAGLTDWAMVSVRGDVLWSGDSGSAWATYGGVRLGTAPGVVVSAVLLALVAAGSGAS